MSLRLQKDLSIKTYKINTEKSSSLVFFPLSQRSHLVKMRQKQCGTVNASEKEVKKKRGSFHLKSVINYSVAVVAGEKVFRTCSSSRSPCWPCSSCSSSSTWRCGSDASPWRGSASAREKKKKDKRHERDGVRLPRFIPSLCGEEHRGHSAGKTHPLKF